VNIQIKFAIVAIVIVIPLSIVAVYVTNSNQQFTTTDNSKLQVISSFYSIHEFAQNVGQEKVDVTLLVPIGVEPHDWEPTIKDVQRIQNSDLIIINGLGFENWVDNLDESDYRGVIVDTSNEILVKDLNGEYVGDSGDPHIWLNPVYAKIQVQNRS
jgi:zinc transport system substrate-binding protein